jgi:hypothetical protein
MSILVFWVVNPCNKRVCSFPPWRRTRYASPKCWLSPPRLHGVKTQKTTADTKNVRIMKLRNRWATTQRAARVTPTWSWVSHLYVVSAIAWPRNVPALDVWTRYELPEAAGNVHLFHVRFSALDGPAVGSTCHYNGPFTNDALILGNKLTYIRSQRHTTNSIQ